MFELLIETGTFPLLFSGEEVGESVAFPLGIGLNGGMIFMVDVFF